MISKATKNADIYTNENSVVMYLQAKKYKVTVDVEYEDYGMPRSATVVIEPSDEPVTESLRDPNLAYHYNPWSAYYNSYKILLLLAQMKANRMIIFVLSTIIGETMEMEMFLR
jgi:deoxyinosine 3'endonuclease (endonuclease V)